MNWNLSSLLAPSSSSAQLHVSHIVCPQTHWGQHPTSYFPLHLLPNFPQAREAGNLQKSSGFGRLSFFESVELLFNPSAKVWNDLDPGPFWWLWRIWMACKCHSCHISDGNWKVRFNNFQIKQRTYSDTFLLSWFCALFFNLCINYSLQSFLQRRSQFCKRVSSNNIINYRN